MSTGLSPEEIGLIIDFYLLHAPILKTSTEKGDGFGYRSLAEYGWKGTGDNTSLERKLLCSSGIEHFVFLKAKSMKNTLVDMKLADSICSEHPRAVLLMKFSADFSENGEIKVNPSETRMVCLFRHIRNSIAHNRTYVFDNGNMILLEDCEDKETLTARILLPTRSLLEWVRIIDKDKKYYFKDFSTEIIDQIAE